MCSQRRWLAISYFTFPGPEALRGVEFDVAPLPFPWLWSDSRMPESRYGGSERNSDQPRLGRFTAATAYLLAALSWS